MPDKKSNIKFRALSVIIFLPLFLLQYNSAFSLKIGNANPMLPLCLVIVYSMFATELDSALFGLFAGIVTDGAAATPICFNAIVMMLLALAVSFTAHYLFNNNVHSAVAFGLICSLCYYLLRWIITLMYGGLQSKLLYLLTYVFPSVIYTAIVTIPLFYLFRFLSNKFYVR